MKVTLIITFAVVFIGICISNANAESIRVNSFEVGNCAKVVCTVPPTGRVSLNVYEGNDNILLQVDYRVNRVPNTSTIVLNTKTGGVWGTD